MKMSDYIRVIGRFRIIDILKPLFVGRYISRVLINVDEVKKARQDMRYLVIRTPTGESILLPKAINMKKEKIIEKVFLRPNEPMKMIPFDIPHCTKRPDEFYEVS